MLFKNKLALAVLLAAPLFASAATTNGQLTFTWTGTIPAKVLSEEWEFTDATGNVFTPTPQVLNSNVDSDGKLHLITSSPVTFNIKPKTKNASSNISEIKAYLASKPIVTGLKGSKQLELENTLVAPSDDHIVVTVNDQLAKVGSGDAVTLAGTGNDRPISIALYAQVAEENYTAGSNVSIITPVIFSVDLASSGSTGG